MLCFQLRDVKVRALAELLEKSNSSYFSYFRSIFQDVVAGNAVTCVCYHYSHNDNHSLLVFLVLHPSENSLITFAWQFMDDRL